MRKFIDIVENTVLWNGKQVAWNDDDFYVCVDDLDDASYVTVWTADNEKVGELATRGTLPGHRQYLSVSKAELKASARGRGLGLRMYEALLSHLSPRYAGIVSYQPDVVNTKQVPAIYRRLGAQPLDGNADILVIRKKSA